MENLNKILFFVLFLSSCTLTSYVYDPIYEDDQHTTEVYWVTDYEIGGTPYFGYWEGFWFYYGIPHYYPWWYYYQFIPPYHYHKYTHVHIHCNNGYYVHYGHRKNLFNNKDGGEYKASISLKTKDIKTNTFPINWKSNNSTRINKQNNDINKINIKPNVNRNINKNIRNNNKIKVNNGSTRPNKTNTSRKPK